MARNYVVVVVWSNMFKGQVSVLPLQMDMDLSLTIAITYNLGTSLTCAYSVNLLSLLMQFRSAHGHPNIMDLELSLKIYFLSCFFAFQV